MTQHAQPTPLRLTLQAEGAAVAALCTLFYAQGEGGWMMFALLILAPDLFMLGYLAGNRVGALCYNIGHSYLTPLALAGGGAALNMTALLPVALIWGVHIGIDRAIGYGLKYSEGFKSTHLNRL